MTQRYRVAPTLLVYPASLDGSRRLVGEVNSGRPPVYLHHPRVAWALSVLPETFDRAQATEAWIPGIADPATRSALWDALAGEGLLIEAGGGEASLWDRLQPYGWMEAASYHEATRDYPFLKMDEP